MQAMFVGTSAFNQNIGNWDVRKVTDMRSMFQSSGFNNGGSPDINNWSINTTLGANVLMNNMFVSGSFNQPLDSWNTSEVTNMSLMFGGSPFNNGLSLGVAGTLAWNTAKVTRMDGMFGSNSRFNCNIGSWNVSNCIKFSTMFQEASNFNNGGSSDINNWPLKTTGDIDMTQMFYRTPAFNQPLGSWNVSRVTSMQEMFSAVSTTSIFNQDISSWDVSRVTSFSQMFNNASAFNNGANSDNNSVTGVQGINGWNINTSVGVSVIMASMFQNATAFNRNIGSWNVSKVTNFSNFMLGKTSGNFSTANLDAIYNGWIVNGVQPNISSPLTTNISFGTTKYTAAGTPGKNILIGAPNNWIIIDGGI
jgi:surface protein